MLTYKQAFDRLTEAYINGEVNAFDARFCFCGNLECGKADWSIYKMRMPTIQSAFNYHPEEYWVMENAFMKKMITYFDKGFGCITAREMIQAHNDGDINLPGYEDVLWESFNDALAELRRIHAERGEDVDVIEMPRRERKLQRV